MALRIVQSSLFRIDLTVAVGVAGVSAHMLLVIDVGNELVAIHRNAAQMNHASDARLERGLHNVAGSVRAGLTVRRATGAIIDGAVKHSVTLLHDGLERSRFQNVALSHLDLQSR